MKPYKRQYTTQLFVLVGFLAACVIAFVSLISIEMGVAIFALSSVGFIIAFDRNRRSLWEQATDFKLQTYRQKHDSLAREVIRNRNRLEDVRDDMASTKNRVKAVSYQSLVGKKKKQSNAPQPRKVLTAKPAQNLNAHKAQILDIKSEERVMIDHDHGLSDLVVEELIRHAVQNRKVDAFLQPIVQLPQRKRAYYEVLGRIRAKPGVYVTASRYQKLAQKQDFMRDIDALLLGQVLSLLKGQAHMQNGPGFFMNITRASLKNKHFMGNLLSFVASHKHLAKRLILELSAKDFHNLSVPELKIVSGLSKLGISLSLDHVETLNIDIPDLQRFCVRYLKIDADHMARTINDESQFKSMMKTKRLLEGNGIAVIANRVEDDKQLRGLLDFNLRYAQGFLFGQPDTQSVYAGSRVASKLRPKKTTHG